MPQPKPSSAWRRMYLLGLRHTICYPKQSSICNLKSETGQPTCSHLRALRLFRGQRIMQGKVLKNTVTACVCVRGCTWPWVTTSHAQLYSSSCMMARLYERTRTSTKHTTTLHGFTQHTHTAEGSTAAWLHGCTAARAHGRTAAWLLGCSAARLHGCTAARGHGCV